MGAWFDVCTSKFLLPYFTFLATKTLLQPLSENPISQPIPSVKTLFDPGECYATSRSSALSSPHCAAPAALLTTEDRPAGGGPAAGHARLHLGRAHANPVGALHGGGIALMAESVSRAVLARPLAAAGAGSAPRALSVRLRIPRPVRVDRPGGAEVALHCELLPRHPAGGPLASRVTVEHAGALCSVAELTWSVPSPVP